jgi:hypothetical protein
MMRDQNTKSNSGLRFLAFFSFAAIFTASLLAFAAKPAGATGTAFVESVGSYFGFGSEKSEDTINGANAPLKLFRRTWLKNGTPRGSSNGSTKAVKFDTDVLNLSAWNSSVPSVALDPMANLLIYTYSPEVDSLFRFSSDSPGTTTQIPLTGIDSANFEILEFIDFRPVNGLLYAVANNPAGSSRVVTVNITTGQVTTAGSVPSISGTFYGGDFNPTVDVIREVSRTASNRRLSPSGGVVGSDTNLAYASGDPGFGITPNVVHVAYSNNFVGASSTTLYGIDTNRDVLVTIGSQGGSPVSPNTGQLFTVGPLGVNASSFGGFDIHSGTNLAYAALTVGGFPTLYRIDLSTGTATEIGQIVAANPNPDPENPNQPTRIDGLSIAPGGASANLSITKTDNSATYSPGSVRPYIIVASNAGPDPVSGAVVSDALTTQFTSASWTCSGTGGGTCPSSGTGGINAAVNLPVGGSVTFNFQATTSSQTAGNLTNTATITVPAGVSDINPGNNSVTDTDTQAAPGPTATATATATATPTFTPTATPTVEPTPAVRTNHALAANGGIAAGSSESNPASNANDGSRAWGVGGAWKDATPGVFPDTLQVTFNGTKAIDEISVFAVRDDYTNTTPPDLTTTTTQYSLIDFQVQYWTGSTWVTVPGGNITGNNKAWVRLTFSPIATTRVRVLVNNAALDGYSRVVELEAWGGGAGAASPTPTATATVAPPATATATPTATATATPAGPTPTATATATPPSGPRTNFALAANGGVATASSEVNPATNANDGSRAWAVGGAWKDATPGAFPDTLQIDFNGTKSIDEISVFAVRDDFNNTTPPDLTTTTTSFSLIDFQVQYWTGSAWATVPGGTVTGNNKAWVKLTFSPISTTKVRVVVNNASQDGYSRIVELEAWGGGSPAPTPTATATVTPTATATATPPGATPTATATATPPGATPTATATATPPAGPRINQALASNGGVATGSTELNAAANAIDGSRAWGVGGAWKDSTPGTFPDTLQVDFNGTKSIDEISVFAVKDDYQSTTPPDLTTTTTQYSLVDFTVQYWNGSAWVTVPGGNVTGNNKAWVKLTFAAVSASKVRVVVTNASLDGYTRVVELEAWGVSGAAPPATVRKNHALASNGSFAVGSTELNPASNAINGSRVWAVGGAWKDSTPSTYPDSLEVSFGGSRSIDEIDVFAVMDDFNSTTPPDLTTTTSAFSLVSFDVQYWNGSSWVTVPGGAVAGNNKAWVKLTFPAVTTTKIRVVVNNAADGYSRIVELEAWGDVPA